MKYKIELNQLINTANDLLRRKHATITLRYDYIAKNGGYRIIAYNNKVDLIRFYISPRMSIKNLIIWFNGFIEGLDF